MVFPFCHQLDAMDCGPACLKMTAEYYGRNYSLQTLRKWCFTNKNGVSMLGIVDAAEHVGFRTLGLRTSFDKFCTKVVLPCIVHWRSDHFVVVYKIKIRRHKDTYKGKVYVADPAFGLVTYTVEEFLEGWYTAKINGEDRGVALMLSPTPKFYENIFKEESKKGISWFLNYLRPYRKYFFQIILSFVFGLVLQLIFPFLTQSTIDVGVLNNDLNFILLILIAQFVLHTSQMFVDLIESWLFLHVTNRVNIFLISDFLNKLLKLPIVFFDSKKTGDILQRINDHSRVQGFLTGTTLSIFFSFFSFIIFACILAWYKPVLLVIFLIGYSLYTVWVMLFMKIRRVLDFKRFEKASKNQSSLIQMIEGVQDIKLNNYEFKMRWKWEKIQSELFEVNVKGLTISQIQSSGSFFISNLVNIIISYLTAKYVVTGNMTLGMMMATSYIIGQMRGPINNFIGFIHSYQDASISIERIGEVHFEEDETQLDIDKIKDFVSDDRSIVIDKISFSYLGPSAKPVLNNISFEIPQNKVTAIVGASGSGKTTLLKLLLGNYSPQKGRIKIGGTDLQNINLRFWRTQCGTVMQDGFIFSESIAENIAPTDDIIDTEKLYEASIIANVHEFAENQPGGYNTMIGQEGSGLSQGQKQRILIARAVYKDPQYMFFDEATNSLDAKNEKEIMENLQSFYRGRTVVIIAHRLSTVKHADQIIVLDEGQIMETGTHNELLKKKGMYYELVQNQLELDC